MINLSPIVISLKTAIAATLITFVLGVTAARWMLTYRGKARVAIEAVLTAPLVLPPTVVGFLLLLLFGKQGFLGRFLEQWGITVIFSWYATAIAATIVAFPLMYKTALAAFQQIDAELIACARTLGASEWQVFWRVLMPLAKSGLIAGIMLSFARALGEFGATLMLAGNIPGKTQTIPIAIFIAAESGEMDRALFLVVVMLLISLAVITVVNYYSSNPQTKTNWLRIDFAPKLWLRSKQPKTSAANDDRIKLVVEIEKQLPGFLLSVSFVAGRSPLGILGASGAGKSLILRCIAGLETPDRGRIVLNGRVLFDSQQGINILSRDRACGFLWQNYALFPHLTVAENIAFGITGESASKIKRQIAAELLAVNLEGMENRYPEQLSGGQQQRLALARARARNPEILLLDEPFSALDTYLKDKVIGITANSLNDRRRVTLFVTHNLSEAYRLCPHLLIIDRGNKIAFGSREKIFKFPPNAIAARLTGCENISRAVAISETEIAALDWNCSLEVAQTNKLSYVGIRGEALTIVKTKLKNTFPCWLAATSLQPHRLTLYLKLHQPANHPSDYQIQTTIAAEKWLELKHRAFPWSLQFPPQALYCFAK